MIRLLIIIFFINSCASNKSSLEGFTIVRFKEKIPVGDKLNEQHYLMDVPKGGLLKKFQSGHIATEYQITYPDSSIIYITNEEWSGSRINWLNRDRAKLLNAPKSLGDTLQLYGIQDIGLNWRDNFMGEIVVGYANVPASRLHLFEQALMTLRKYK